MQLQEQKNSHIPANTDMLFHCIAVSKIRLSVYLRFNAPNVVCCCKARCSLCHYHHFPLVISYFLQLLLNRKFSLSPQKVII